MDATKPKLFNRLKHEAAHRPSDYGHPKECNGRKLMGQRSAEHEARIEAEAARVEAELVALDNETRRHLGLPEVWRIEDVFYH